MKNLLSMLNKLQHFYFNKYLVSPFSKEKYYLSYCLDHKALWYRVPKVGTRTIDEHLKEGSTSGGYIYSSRVGYLPSMYKNFLKFAFVRDPQDRLVSAWKNKVAEANYFNFEADEYQKMQKFDEFVVWLSTQDINQTDEHLLPQYKLVDYKNLDFLGRFESFSDDFSVLAKKIGLPIDQVHHKNSSKKANIEISPATKSLIEEIYRNDFEIFNY